MKKGFTIYNDSLEIIDELTDEQVGILLRAIKSFNRGDEFEIQDPIVRVCFAPFKNQFIREGIGKSPLEISKINKANRLLRNSTKPNESNEINESVHISKSISKGNVKVKLESELKIFDEFRQIYGGVKKGNQTEFDNFIKKHKDWETELPKLKPLLEQQIAMRNKNNEIGAFVPEWKMLSTYINGRCWEEIIPLGQPKNKGNDSMQDIISKLDNTRRG